ncbi:hypothetical protein DVH24_026137 [Malus domestica]|uniref:Uncharacterized protein n=1 Tax=Malus domestica TaxID=3750 RepID=A0A498KIK2_MALDO|nr:hypothetical protein DVH24_026137 [Malus domestica]
MERGYITKRLKVVPLNPSYIGLTATGVIIPPHLGYLTGSIPREIGNLTMVKGIYLDYNNFEGILYDLELPNEISCLGQLEE